MAGPPVLPPSPVVGVYHEAPDAIVPCLRACVPNAQLRLCTRWDSLDVILPEIDVLLAYRFRGRAFPRQQILAAPRLKWVQLSSAGIDHLLPFDPARLVVTNTSGLHGDSIAWVRPWPGSSTCTATCRACSASSGPASGRAARCRRRADGRWQLSAPGASGLASRRRRGRSGCSRSGSNRSGRAVPEFDAVYPMAHLHEVLARADYAVIALPLTAATRGCIGEAALACLRPTAYLANVARGGIVDEAALLRRLRDGGLAGAVLDVFEQEPLPPASELWSLPNVLITPHVAGEFERWPRRWRASSATTCDAPSPASRSPTSSIRWRATERAVMPAVTFLI